MNTPSKVMIVDDEHAVRRVVQQYLEKEGYQVVVAKTGNEALEQLYATPPDLIILDIMLPGLDGLTFTRMIRNPVDHSPGEDFQHIPIIMLTARTREEDRIVGFELGADDYVLKPFSPRELVMRVRALLRRTSGTPDQPVKVGQSQPIEFDGLMLDPNRYVVERNSVKIDLTHKEFELLYFLARNPGQVFSRSDLLNKVWGYDFYGDDSNVTVHIHRLREKIEPDVATPTYIHTVWGVGYKFEVQ